MMEVATFTMVECPQVLSGKRTSSVQDGDGAL